MNYFKDIKTENKQKSKKKKKSCDKLNLIGLFY